MKKKTSHLRAFAAGLQKAANVSRHPIGKYFAKLFMRFYARKTMRAQQAQRITDDQPIDAVAAEFQRMFPTKKLYRLRESDNETAILEIHAQCPLRGTGDVHACHRMMEYDRTMADHIGGTFRVLESQSNSGDGICVVALRKKGRPVEDLVEPHER